MPNLFLHESTWYSYTLEKSKYMNLSCGKEIFDVASTLLTLVIAIVVAIVGWQQWRVNESKLKYDKYDRRIELYSKIIGFISCILTSGTVSHKDLMFFLRETKEAHFVFGEDISNMNKELFSKVNNLCAYCSTEKNLSGVELENNLDKQMEIKKWLENELSTIESKFEKYF